MLEYYFEKYKQIIYFLILAAILVFGLGYGYYLYVATQNSGIGFFRLQVYPESTLITCSENINCNSWKEYNFKEYSIVSFTSEKFTSQHKSQEFIQNLVQNTQGTEYLKGASANIIFNKVQDRGMTDKKNRGEKLSQLELECLRGIEASIVLGSHEQEETMQKRFIRECRTMTGDVTPDLAVVESIQKESLGTIKLEVNSVRVKYTFFSSENGELTGGKDEYIVFPIKQVFSLE